MRIISIFNLNLNWTSAMGEPIPKTNRWESPARLGLRGRAPTLRCRQRRTASRGRSVTKAADRLVFGSSWVLSVYQLGNRRQVPHGSIFPCKRMRPAISDIRNRLRIDAANDDVKWLGLFPVDDQRIRSLIGCSIQLAWLDAGNMRSRLEQLAGK